MQILPNGKSQFIDSAGQPLASGTVGFYFPGTLNPKTTYQDSAGTIANTNPVQLDSRGQAVIWGSGVYRQIVQDASGVTIWDQLTEDPNAGLTGNITDAIFVSGVDFTPGTTTQLTLPVAPGSVTNLWAFFDASYQADDQITSVIGTTLTFNAPIPIGVQKVYVKIGATIAMGTPSAGTVTDTSVASGAGIQSSKLSYIQGSAGAVARTIQSRLQGTISAKDFGAVGNGSTDDTAALTAFFAALQSAGQQGYLPDGTYNVSSGFVINNPITLRGSRKSIIHNTNASLAVPIIHISSSGAQYTTLEGFRITSVTLAGGTPAVAGIEVDAGQEYILRDLDISGTQRGIFIGGGSAGAVIDGCFVSNTSFDGYNIIDGDIVVTNCYAVTCGAWGFNFSTTNGSGGNTLSNCTAAACMSGGFLFQGSASALMVDVFVSNCVSSYTPGGPGMLFDTHGKNIILSGCYVEAAGLNTAGTPQSAQPGIRFTGSNHRVSVNGCQSTFCGGTGLQMDCSYFSVTGGDYTANGLITYGTYPGLLLGSAAPIVDFSVTGVNTVPLSGLDVNSQSYGISLGQSGNAAGTITGNVLGGTLGALNIPTPSSVSVAANAGFVNEASGTITIPAGSTAVSVTHGMNVTPSMVNVSINGATGPINLVVSAGPPNSTGFTVFMSATSGAAVAVGWYARQ